MKCYRSEKHSSGLTKSILLKDIREDQMFIPPIKEYTDFRIGDVVHIFRPTESISSYDGTDTVEYIIPPPGTVLSITQDTLC